MNLLITTLYVYKQLYYSLYTLGKSSTYSSLYFQYHKDKGLKKLYLLFLIYFLTYIAPTLQIFKLFKQVIQNKFYFIISRNAAKPNLIAVERKKSYMAGSYPAIL